MRRRDIQVTAETSANVEVVFALLADGTTWPQWSAVESVELERSDTEGGEGPGAIRVLRRGRTTGRDEILEVVPNRRMTYRSLSGLPVRDYVGEVDLERSPAGGTIIRWHSSFLPARPGTGWVLERGLRRFLQQCASGLAAYAAYAAARMRPPSAFADESA